tara:strand:- start:8620 stop:9021 length:402 start_codon:yes stop_codon:yes gene_type:complete
MDVNEVRLIGHIGMMPELKDMGSFKVCNFTLATNYKSKEGIQRTDWHKISVFNKLAEVCNQHLKKGAHIYLDGRLHVENWEKDGEKRRDVSVKAKKVIFLGKKESKTENGFEDMQVKDLTNSLDDFNTSDIPF